ncbi:MAG TPA: SMP-30/gluconolactonase/LRE family protein [Verrucomicrobiae bacterium]|jgi:sugar lactone lactonase YvrE/enterochelin esterase-like enzyme|nr:SMP-30/gluconolactonase/LRE family protein [Verrucomicrobiae bacterium]
MRPTSLVVAFFLTAATAFAIDDYKPGPDSLPQPGVPHGQVTSYTIDQSKIFPGTTRTYWIYVPQQYDPAKPAPLLIMQDGIRFNAPNVLDNLINKKDIPPIIAAFVAPGVVPALSSNTTLPRFNRSYEYDGLSDEYAHFLLDELLPHIVAEQKLNLSTNANDRMIAGESSGAIAAFTAAWHRPDAFRRVFSAIGTYVGLRGGNEFPTLIRKTEPKPIRIFLQDGSNDLNIYGGNWFLADQEMLSALDFAGYDVNYNWGDGAHNGKHSTSIFPDAMRWLWRDYPAPIAANPDHKTNQPISTILLPDEGWQLVAENLRGADGLTANAAGEVFFSDHASNCIYKIALDGQLSVFKKDAGTGGLIFGPDGKLYAGQGGQKRVVSYDADGKEEIVAEDLQPNDLVAGQNGNLYVTDSPNKKVWLIHGHEKRLVDEGIASPNGIRFSPDQSLLYVADYHGQFVYSFDVLPDGSLANRQRFYHLHLMDGSTQSSADGLTMDSLGWLYVTTEMGIQVCDQPGRVEGIILKPQAHGPSSIAFGGKNFDTLFAACGDKVFKRKTQARGVLSFQPPIKPPTPHL